MNTIEIIEIRAHAGRDRLLLAGLERLVDEINASDEKMTLHLYRRVGVDADFALQLLHDIPLDTGEGSSTALRLVQALKDSGLVNHSVWMEHHPALTQDDTTSGE